MTDATAMKNKIFNIPNMLCYFRVAAIPLLTGLFYLDHALAGAAWPAWAATVLFSLAAATDFLDGQIARATGQTTLLGKFLDSSTDKMLIGAMLFLLVAFGRIDGIWIVCALMIYLREIFISGVREFLGLYNISVPVTWIAKWKLTCQAFAIGFLTAGTHGEMLVPYAVFIGHLLFAIATFMTVWSGWDYLRTAWKNVLQLEAEGKI